MRLEDTWRSNGSSDPASSSVTQVGVRFAASEAASVDSFARWLAGHGFGLAMMARPMPTSTTDRLAPKPVEAEQHSSFWQNAHGYFDRVYQQMNLDDTVWRAVLSSPQAGADRVVPGADGRRAHPGVHRISGAAQQRPGAVQGRDPVRHVGQPRRGDGPGHAADVEERPGGPAVRRGQGGRGVRPQGPQRRASGSGSPGGTRCRDHADHRAAPRHPGA